jgi:TRAP-type C4-dicarboxylate transport system substrate-binding protein
VLVFSKQVWDELSQEDQAIIRAAAKESVPYMRRVWDGYQISARMLIEKSGGQIIDDVDRASFADVLLPLYPRLVPSPQLQDLVKRSKSMD